MTDVMWHEMATAVLKLDRGDGRLFLDDLEHAGFA
jgi:hypothetical protein